MTSSDSNLIYHEGPFNLGPLPYKYMDYLVELEAHLKYYDVIILSWIHHYSTTSRQMIDCLLR